MKKHKKAVTKVHVRILVDESGSMENGRDAAIEHVNTYVKTLAEMPGEISVSLATFDAYANAPMVRSLCDEAKVADVPPLSHANYRPRGNTPLYDAMANMILAGSEDAQTIFVVETDGLENASREYRSETIKALVAAREAKGWRFVFLGAGMDRMTATGLAATVGIKAGDTMNFSKSPRQYGAGTANLSASTARYTASVAAGQAIPATMDWFEPEEQDVTKAKPK